MPYLNEITTKINAAISSKLIEPEFVSAKFFQIAYPFPEVKGKDVLIKVVPAVVDNDGEGTDMIDINDNASLKIYHRIVTNNYQYAAAKSGDKYIQKWTADMYMIVVGMRKALQTSAEELEQKIVRYIPTTISLNSVLGISQLLILPYQSDMDFISVFKQEFQQVSYFLKPENILFKIRYRITADVDPACLQ